ncbi:hypothetical protein FA10DRAFT_269122 [Acaromyces ingoldii]|uniref:Uncharacterized protein n=1 Tax=Acaromyces ingoldii TaxID=215250 RepID=A0A316YGU9_9BASI|nr:hypothetical protein FA10DRAFT_269122 [Acaromyces ingoldii]PWN87838.1 hypothetical protein FA10DRAFT_269122 [Acaromyces ingoldii]
MPGSKHELHGFDCHPLGGGTIEGTFQAPSLLITATGVVAHHTPSSLSAMPPSNAPASSTSSSRRGVPAEGSDPSVPIDSLPRAFSQNFVLVNNPQGEGGVNCSAGDEKPIVGKYFIQADTLRFVG